MVSRNVRNSANSYIYRKKREFELETVKEYIEAIETKRYILKLIKHDTIKNAVVSSDKEDKNLINQLLKTVELLPTNMLTLSKPIKCQSRYIGYRAVVCLVDNSNKEEDQYLDINSKHLQGYIRHYVKNTVLGLLKERKRILSVKLRLCEPNEEEQNKRNLLRMANEKHKERNRDMVEKIVNTYEDDPDTRFRVLKTKKTTLNTRRKLATKEEKKKLLDEAKKRIEYSKTVWKKTENQAFSCSFTVLYAEKTNDTVIDKSLEKMHRKTIYPEPRVVSLERVLGWLKCLEGSE